MHLICFFIFCHAADVTQPFRLPETLPSATRNAAPEKQPLPKEEVGKMLKWLVKISNIKIYPHNFSFSPIELLLPEGWKHTLPKEQHLWVSKAFFTRDKSGRLALTKNLRHWWHPPGPRPLYSQPPSSPNAFYHVRLFLWVPYRLLAYRLLCSQPRVPYRLLAYRLLCSQPNCRRLGFPLTACGIYKTVRRVLDVSGWYFMATEYLECRSCKKKLGAWSHDILNQLDPVHRKMFPAVLNYRLTHSFF